MRFWACIGLSAAVAAGCSDKVGKRAKKLERQGDEPPVVVVDREVRGVSNLASEVEPNDEVATAMKLVAPAGVRATMATESDVDLYQIKVPEDGQLGIEITGVKGVDLKVDIVAGDEVIFRSDRGGLDISEGFPNLPVSKDETVVVRVSEFISKARQRRRKRKKEKPRQGASGPYDLRAVLTVEPAQGMEVEPNGKSEGARELMLGERGKGFFGWNRDRDRWRVSLLGFSPGHSLDLSVTGVPGIAITMEVLAPDGKTITKRTGSKGQSVFIYSLEPGKGPRHYDVVVSGSRSNPVDHYQFKAWSRRFEPGDEIEPNDDAASASRVGEDGDSKGEVRGTLAAGDRDVLSLPKPAEASVLGLDLEVPPGGDFKVTVRQSGKALAEADGGKQGAAEKLVGVPIEPGKTILVIIAGKHSGDDPGEYRMSWSYAADGGFDEPPPDELE
ncbi:MAG: hypothetical protein KJO07_20295 [Deltaproteobacteria bacterium]|nr:hypothetical protein [Deltaproteobacteria bacterium]